MFPLSIADCQPRLFPPSLPYPVSRSGPAPTCHPSHLHLTMGNEQSHAGGYGYIEKQMSNATGKDVSTLQNFYSDFQKECPNGQLSPQKFTELCEKVLGSSKAAEFKSKAFGQFDKHSNGSINFRDFLMVIHLTSTGSPEDKLRTMFSLYDRDGNGSIDASEMER